MAICMALFCFVMVQIGDMVRSAIKVGAAGHDAEAQSGLLFIYYATVVVWSAFPLAWLLQEFNLVSVFNAEMIYMFANFMAKVRCHWAAVNKRITCLELLSRYCSM